MRNAVSRGCPQEGVLLFLWCLVVDVLIARLARGGIYIQGYADDIHLLVVGRFLNISLWLVQWALHTVGTRCSLVRFSVYHDKTELILTRRRKLSGFFEPYFFGVSQASGGSSAFSADLTWREHVDVKVRKAHNLLWACWRACGMMWGQRPKVVHWLHNDIIWPSITFAF